jgi:hypothetical protein
MTYRLRLALMTASFGGVCLLAVGCGSTGGTSDNGAAGSGTTGVTGTSGTAGVTGTSGTAGVAGTSGTAGVAGTSGTAGVSGAGGSAGVSGAGGSASTDSCAASFSFFVTSYQALQGLIGADGNPIGASGLGGDLRYPKTTSAGTDTSWGAGLRGADAICTVIAESVAPGNGKVWHAFLSIPGDAANGAVNAISRIGNGPWYDCAGRLFANTLTELNQGSANMRPPSADQTIRDDFSNEFGLPNHDWDQNGSTTDDDDNHDFLTGSDMSGNLVADRTCDGWTSTSAALSGPRVGHSWTRGSSKAGNDTGTNMLHWVSALNEGGCSAGINLVDNGGPEGTTTVGGGGGYGGFYCFAVASP